MLPFLRRHLQRALAIRERIGINEETFHLILAGFVGILGGLTNLLFYASVELVMAWALHGTGDVADIAAHLPEWKRATIPIVGAFFAGLILFWGLRLIKNQAPSNILKVVVSGNGKLPLRTALVKGLSSLISIGTGASIGREGSIVQLSATFSSRLGILAKWPPYRLRLLVACGAAAGMSAAYNAPVAGSIFAAQIVLGNFSMNLFAPLIVASVVSTMLSRYFFGIRTFYEVPQFDFTNLAQLPWFLVLGIGSGVLAAIFQKLLHQSELLFQKLRLPLYGRMALGG
ncbi:MAG: chloride channel protein, partial [Verrucomicrobiota bacterium]